MEINTRIRSAAAIAFSLTVAFLLGAQCAYGVKASSVAREKPRSQVTPVFGDSLLDAAPQAPGSSWEVADEELVRNDYKCCGDRRVTFRKRDCDVHYLVGWNKSRKRFVWEHSFIDAEYIFFPGFGPGRDAIRDVSDHGPFEAPSSEDLANFLNGVGINWPSCEGIAEYARDLRVRSGNCSRAKQGRVGAEFGLNFSSSSVAWNTSIAWPKFAMQWDDARKKLVFDGRPVSHGKVPVDCIYGMRISNDDLTDEAAPDCPDEYSFDVAGPFGAVHLMPRDCTGDLVRESGAEHDIRFSLHWNEDKGTFVIEESGIPNIRPGHCQVDYSIATGSAVRRPVIPGGLLWCGH
jgi:hypothetical protein